MHFELLLQRGKRVQNPDSRVRLQPDKQVLKTKKSGTEDGILTVSPIRASGERRERLLSGYFQAHTWFVGRVPGSVYIPQRHAAVVDVIVVVVAVFYWTVV